MTFEAFTVRDDPHHGRRFLAAVLFAGVATIVTAAAARSQSLDDQARCATQANAAFDRWRLDAAKASVVDGTTNLALDHESHFNSKLNRCLVLIKQRDLIAGGRVSMSSTLLDVYDRRVFATYNWISDPARKDSEVAPAVCQLFVAPDDPSFCEDQDTFDDFVARYMQE